MAQYHIECKQCLGISHDGAVYTDGEGTVELSDEEVEEYTVSIPEAIIQKAKE